MATICARPRSEALRSRVAAARTERKSRSHNTQFPPYSWFGPSTFLQNPAYAKADRALSDRRSPWWPRPARARAALPCAYVTLARPASAPACSSPSRPPWMVITFITFRAYDAPQTPNHVRPLPPPFPPATLLAKAARIATHWPCAAPGQAAARPRSTGKDFT